MLTMLAFRWKAFGRTCFSSSKNPLRSFLTSYLVHKFEIAIAPLTAKKFTLRLLNFPEDSAFYGSKYAS